MQKLGGENRMDREILKSFLSVGEVFQNPQKGTSKIKSVNDNNITYIRGSSQIQLPIYAFLSVINDFAGKKCSSKDLRNYMPEVFDSQNPKGRKGHSCNCTFLFRVAEKMEIIENGIQGKGVYGNPYYVVFK